MTAGLAPNTPLDYIVVRMKPDLIEHGDLRPMLEVLREVTSTPERMLRLRNGIRLSALYLDEGNWTADAKIASFAWQLYLAWPHWFFFAERAGGTLGALLSCALHALERREPALIQERLDQFYEIGRAGLEVIATKCGMNDDDIKEMLGMAMFDLRAVEVFTADLRGE